MAANEEPATKKDISNLEIGLKELEKRLEKKINESIITLVEAINTFAKHVDHRFELVESRLDTIAVDLSKIKAGQDVMQHEYDRLAEASGF